MTQITKILDCNKPPNGSRYWRWGGIGFCLGAEKTRIQKNAGKRRAPSLRAAVSSVQCTLCWAVVLWVGR